MSRTYSQWLDDERAARRQREADAEIDRRRAAFPNMPTYVCLRTIDGNGNLLTHLPTAERIVAVFPPIGPNTADYAGALASADAIRQHADGGWAIPVDEADLELYEPSGGDWRYGGSTDRLAAVAAAVDRYSTR